MRLEKPLAFNICAALAMAALTWRNPQLLPILQDLAMGGLIGVALAAFAHQQASSANPRDYD